MSKNLQFVLIGIAVLFAGMYFHTAFGLIGLLLISWPVVAWLWKLIGGGNGETQLDQWLRALPDTKYKYGNDEHGIALDEAKSEIHLFTYGISKTYPFSEIRGFTTNIATGGKMIAGFGTGLAATAHALSVASANKAQERQNQDATGIFISVKDIDHPEWRIKFSKYPHDEERLQKQWMEIFRQVVNKD